MSTLAAGFATPDELTDPDDEIRAEANRILEKLRDGLRYFEAQQDGSENWRSLMDGQRMCVDSFAAYIAERY